MFAADTTTITVPSWLGRIALPEYPAMSLTGSIMLGLGALVLLIGYFAPIKKLPSLLTGIALLAYYPLAYLLFWFLLCFNRETHQDRQPSKFEVFLLEHIHAFEWVILGLCIFFSVLFFVWTVMATVRKGRRTRTRETAKVDNPFAPQPPMQAAAVPQPAPAGPTAPRPAAPRPAAPPPVPPARQVPKKPTVATRGGQPLQLRLTTGPLPLLVRWTRPNGVPTLTDVTPSAPTRGD